MRATIAGWGSTLDFLKQSSKINVISSCQHLPYLTVLRHSAVDYLPMREQKRIYHFTILSKYGCLRMGGSK